jgi:DivIVA domain-containing protein
LELDRHFIERNDFSAARRGYDPDEVDRHLREIADAIGELKRERKPSPASLATAAADQVRSIVEAAEKSAADIQAQAEAEARRITDDASKRARETREKADVDAVDRVRQAEEATERTLERANGVEGEIDRLLGDLRTSANALVENVNGAARSLTSELDSMRTEFASVREARLEPGGGAAVEEDAGPMDAEPEVVAETAAVAEAAAVTEVEPEPEVLEPEPVAEVEPAVEEEPEEEEQAPVPEPVETPSSGGRSIRGAEGARLIALNMALNGTPRDETARYLSQNFELDDQDGLLDEVYARVGGGGPGGWLGRAAGLRVRAGRRPRCGRVLAPAGLSPPH